MRKGSSNRIKTASNFSWLYRWIVGPLLRVKISKNPRHNKRYGRIIHIETTVEDRKGRPTFYISYTGL